MYTILEKKFDYGMCHFIANKCLKDYSALVTVVIETGAKGWKAYQATFNPESVESAIDEETFLQNVSAHGRKLSKEIAVAMFPKFDPKLYNV